MKRISDFLINNKFLLLVVVLAAFLRLVVISEVPPSLNWDEVSHGYNAYSILNSARDEWGSFLPNIFRAYGDYKLPVYIYVTAVSEFFFGLSEFSVRLPSVLAGIGIVIFTYLLVKEFFNLGQGVTISKDTEYNTLSRNSLADKAAILGAFLVAIEPWTFFLSRVAVEANLALALHIAGLYFFIVGVRGRSKFLIFSAVLFGLTVWTYNSYRVFTPLLLATLGLIFRRQLQDLSKRSLATVLITLFVSALFLLPMFWQLLNSSGQARYAKIEILDEGAIAQINEDRNSGCSRIYCNKITFFAKRFAENYLSHFTFDFLLLKGPEHYQFSVPGFGLLYPINAVFVFLGLLYLFKNKNLTLWTVIASIALAPIPDSLTREAPHALRTMVILPLPMILTALGLVSVYEFLKKRTSKNILIFSYVIYFVILFSSLEKYLSNYFTDYQKNYSWSWQYGYKEAVSYIKANYLKYDKIVMTKRYGEPHEFVLFYWPWDPREYQNDSNLNRFNQSNWYWVDGFDKFYFVNDWQISSFQNQFVLESKKVVDCNNSKCLLLTSPANYPTGWRKLETINFLDGKPAFDILEN